MMADAIAQRGGVVASFNQTDDSSAGEIVSDAEYDSGHLFAAGLWDDVGRGWGEMLLAGDGHQDHGRSVVA